MMAADAELHQRESQEVPSSSLDDRSKERAKLPQRISILRDMKPAKSVPHCAGAATRVNLTKRRPLIVRSRVFDQARKIGAQLARKHSIRRKIILERREHRIEMHDRIPGIDKLGKIIALQKMMIHVPVLTCLKASGALFSMVAEYVDDCFIEACLLY